MKKWTAVQYDLTKALSAVVKSNPPRITIPSGQKLELIIELEDDAYTKLYKDPTWAAKMQEKANAKTTPVLDRVKLKVKQADEKSQKFDQKTADIFSKDINSYISQEMAKAGKEMAAEIDKLFEDYKKGKTELTKFRIKCGGKITLNAIGIVAAAAVAGATHAVLAPPAIVAIVRSSIVIAQECAKLAVDADTAAKLINKELLILVKIMESGKAKAGKEIALSVISGVLGIETPSVTNLEGHIDVHGVKIIELTKKSHELGPKLNDAMDREQKWTTKLKENEKNLSPAKVKKLKEKVAQSVKVLEKMVETVIKFNEGVDRAEERHKGYKKALEDLKKGIPGWVKYVTPITGAAVNVGLAIGNPTSALEAMLGVITSVESDVASTLLDTAL